MNATNRAITIKAGADDGEEVVCMKGTVAGGALAELRIAATDDDGKPKIPTFDMLAYTGGPMYPSGWYKDDPIIFDIAGMNTVDSIPVNAGHFTDIGHTTKVDKSTKGVKAQGVLSAFSPDADDDAATQARTIARMGANGFPYQASIEARVPRKRIEFAREGESIKANGRTFPGPVYVARESTLTKIAILTGAADAASRTSIAATQRDGNDSDTGADHQAMLAESRKAAAAEELRMSGIRGAFAKFPNLKAVPHPTEPVRNGTPFTMEAGEFVAYAIENGMAADTVKLIAQNAELVRIRAERPSGVHGFAHSHETTCTAEALTAAMMLRCGARLDHPSYQSQFSIDRKLPAFLRAGINDANKNQIFEAAHRFSDMSAIDIARECCRLSTGDVPHRRDDMLRAAFSGGSLDKIFTDSINAHLVATYEEAPDSTEGWTQETDVADFKTQSDIRLTKGQGLKKLPRGSKADHQSRGDEAETYQIARYAAQIIVDEQDLIDDSLHALADLPDEMGKAAARLRPDLVYAILLANPTLLTTARQLFNATDDNIDTGSALSLAAIGVGIANMMVKQENGVNLNLVPTHLIVPTSLRLNAKEFISSQQIVVARGGTTDTTVVRGADNVVWDEGLTLVSDARLENGVYDPSTEPQTLRSGSASTWYLACAVARTIIVAYRRGTGRAPQVRSKVLDGGEFGMQWDVSIDIGAKARDFRGFYRATA